MSKLEKAIVYKRRQLRYAKALHARQLIKTYANELRELRQELLNS